MINKYIIERIVSSNGKRAFAVINSDSKLRLSVHQHRTQANSALVKLAAAEFRAANPDYYRAR